MNLVGKIFIVMILVMSLGFMAMAMAVYANHRNYQALFEKTGKELSEVKVLNDQLTSEVKALNDQLNADRDPTYRDRYLEEVATLTKSKCKSLRNIENEADNLTKRRTQLEREKSELERDKRESVATMNTAQKSATDYRTDLEKRRPDLDQARLDRDRHFHGVVELTDERNQAADERKLLQDRLNGLTDDFAKATKCLKYFHIDWRSNYKDKSPPDVDGRVLAVRGSGLIEISIGSDSGLQKGHRLKISRNGEGGASYVGDADVVEATPDRSVCKVDPKFQYSDVRTGDRVSSEIRSR